MNKKFLLCSVLGVALLLGAGVANAQDQVEAPKTDAVQQDGAAQYRHGRQSLKDQLGLTDEQKEQMKEIQAKGKEELKPLEEEMKALRDKRDALRKKQEEDFEKILTPEQQAKLAEIREREAKDQEFKADMNKKMKEFYKRKYSGQAVDEAAEAPKAE